MKSLQRLAYKQKEAAQVLGVSDRTLRVWMDGDNPPPSFRRGKVLLFPRDALINWMNRQTNVDFQNDSNVLEIHNGIKRQAVQG